MRIAACILGALTSLYLGYSALAGLATSVESGPTGLSSSSLTTLGFSTMLGCFAVASLWGGICAQKNPRQAIIVFCSAGVLMCIYILVALGPSLAAYGRYLPMRDVFWIVGWSFLPAALAFLAAGLVWISLAPPTKNDYPPA